VSLAAKQKSHRLGFDYNHDWLIAWLLHREAQTLIEKKN